MSPASATSFAAKTVREDDSWGSVARTFDARQSIVAANAGGASATASDQGASARRARAHAAGSEEAGEEGFEGFSFDRESSRSSRTERRRVSERRIARGGGVRDALGVRIGFRRDARREARGVRGDAPRVRRVRPNPRVVLGGAVAGGSRVARRRRVGGVSGARRRERGREKRRLPAETPREGGVVHLEDGVADETNGQGARERRPTIVL